MNVRRRPGRLEVVPLRTSLLDDVLRIERATFTPPWSRAAFGREIVEPRSRFFCMLHDGRCIGYGGYWQVVDEMHISNIAIEEAFRGCGHGAWLFSALLRDALAQNLASATLEVREQNEAAQQMYLHFGFSQAGRRRGYYQEEGEDALIMWNHDIAATVALLPPGMGVSAPSAAPD